MAACHIRYSLAGKIIKMDKPFAHKDNGMMILTLECTGGFTTQVVSTREFLALHKPEVGHYLIRQLDDTTIVVDEETFQQAQYVSLPCRMDYEQIE